MKPCLLLLAALLTVVLPSTALAAPEPLSQADLAYLNTMRPIVRSAAEAGSGIGETTLALVDGSLTVSRGVEQLRSRRAVLQQSYDDWQQVQPTSPFADTDALFGTALQSFLDATDLVIDGASRKDLAEVQLGSQRMLAANQYVQQCSAAVAGALGPARAA